jgi:membrane protein implicated in regulation of membrane protease activity
MVLLDLFISYGPWAWFVLGLVLLALELVIPGGWFLWVGAAGIATGLISFIPGITWPLEVTVFGLLSLAVVIGWWRYSRNRQPVTDQPFLNNRAARFVGHEAVIDAPIVNGFGKLKLGDTDWRISGPDLLAGQKVRIVGYDVNVLKVEAV